MTLLRTMPFMNRYSNRSCTYTYIQFGRHIAEKVYATTY